MSHIDDLIAEQCPAGVEHRPLQDLIADLRTGLNPRQNFKLNTAGARNMYMTVRELGGFELRPSDKTDRINDGGLALIQNRSRLKPGDVLFSATGTIGRTALVVEPARDWNIKEGVYAITPCTELILSKFLIYLLHSNTVRNTILSQADGSTVASISMATLRKVRVPVPALEVQQEIVRILDQFTQLEAELEAELEARRQQYEHYRNALLDGSFEGASQAVLSDLGAIFGGLTGKTKSDFSDGNARFASYRNIFKNISLDVNAHDFVRVADNERQRSLAYGDVIFTGSSETAHEVGMTSVVTKQLTEPMYLNSFCIGFRPHDLRLLHPDFAKHLFRSTAMRKQIIKTANGVTRINVSKARLARIQVPLPSHAEQERIAKILDKFDALVNDLSVGLPAELAARRKQYEYYRDRLLTFEEAPA